jgi:NitT/TauT family transport system substrate-binding protein
VSQRWPVLLGLLTLLAGCGGAAAPQTPAASSAPAKAAKLAIAYSSVSYAQIALPVAKETGILARDGLDADFVLGPNGVPALIAGEVQAAVTSTEELISADLGGADLITVATMVPYLQHRLLVRPEIKTMADLKGRPVGVSKRGTITHTVLRMGAQRAGLDPDKDLQIVELGTPDKQLAAMAAGAIYASSFSPPNDQVAISQGAHVLYDFPQEHIEYPVAQVMLRRPWAAQHRETVLALLRSLAQAVALTRTDPNHVATIYATWAKTGDAAAKVAVTTAQEQVPVRMAPTATGIKMVLDTVAQTQPAAARADPSRFFDASYVESLDQEGFYANLPH